MYQYKTHSEKNFEKWFKTSPTGNCTFDKDIFQLKFGHYLILHLKSEKDYDEELIKEQYEGLARYHMLCHLMYFFLFLREGIYTCLPSFLHQL